MNRQPPQRLEESDHDAVLDLYRRALYQHIHVDWRMLNQWTGHPDLCCYLLKEDGQVQTLLGATIQPARAAPDAQYAWLRFAISAQTAYVPPFATLWECLRADLKASGIRQVNLITSEAWVIELARRWNFKETNAVITLERRPGQPPVKDAALPSFALHDASRADLETITRIDGAAFEAEWRYSLDTLAVAFTQANSVRMVEVVGQMVAYQLSTWYGRKAHLARLAVLPACQGQGMGRLLVSDMIRRYEQMGAQGITVNTQEDNHRSQRLYHGLGFKPINHRVPIWTDIL